MARAGALDIERAPYFKVFPEVARGLEPDQGLRRRRFARVQRPQQRGHAVFARGDGQLNPQNAHL